MYVKLYFKYLSNSYVLFVRCDVYGDNDEQSLVLRSLLSCVQMEGHALSHGTNSDCLPVSLALYGSLLAQKELGPGTVKLALFHFKIVKYEIV